MVDFVGLTAWQFLLVLAVGIFATLFVLRKPKASQYMAMVKMALVLALFDYAFETWGFLAGFWASAGSVLPLGAVPVEVFGIALCAGATYAMLFPRKFSWNLGLASSLLIACGGTFVEALLIGQGNLAYTGGWTSAHAVVAYFLTFLGMNAVNSQV